jgi:protein-S-isoprenylcysteine O-methyltransferase Ste14
MNPVEVLYSVTTGSRRRRLILTPVGLVLFLGVLLLSVEAARRMDAALSLPPLLPGRPGLWLGALVVAAGGVLCAGCIAFFLGARGTPVPFNPPEKLVTRGPYALSRNPMLAGLFAVLIGLGLLIRSASLVLVVTPILIVASTVELKLVEEPELERRFGADYVEYRRQVPMFLPRVRLRSGSTVAMHHD